MTGVVAPTLEMLATNLAAGRITSRALVEACLARIADPAGEGGRAFLHVMADSARAAADAMDRLRAADAAPSPYAGIPVAIKDLFYRGAAMGAADYIGLLAARRDFIRRVERRIAPFDALALPSVAILPPRIDPLAAEDAYTRANLLALRNTTLINMMDGCAISLPATAPGEAPVGLMLASVAGADRRLLAIAAAAEGVLGGRG